MKVKEIITDAMNLIGRSDGAETYEQGGDDKEVARLGYTMLHCFNSVIDELARGYFPIKMTESFSSDSGLFLFENFSRAPVKINRVTSNGGRVKWHILPKQLQADGKNITVDYNCVPGTFKEDDEFDFGNIFVSPRLIACGMASEYFIICGEVQSALLWESRYRDEIERQMALVPVKDRIPPRRWL